VDAKAPGARVRLLEVEDFFEERQRQLRIWVGRGLGPVVLQPCKAIPCKGVNDRIHVGPGHLQTARDTLFVPAFGPHPDHGPAGVIGVSKLGKGQQGHLQLDGTGMACQEVLDGVMVGLIAEFPLHNADEFAVVDWGIEVLHIQ
jgi:hypothetical protein